MTNQTERRAAPALVGILALILVTIVIAIICALAKPAPAAASPKEDTALPAQGVLSIERMGSTWTVNFDSAPWELKVMEPRIEPAICGTNYGRPCGLVETFILDSDCVYVQVDWPVGSPHQSTDPKVCRPGVTLPSESPSPTPTGASPSPSPSSPPSETPSAPSPTPTSTSPSESPSPSNPAPTPTSSPTTTPPVSTASPTPSPMPTAGGFTPGGGSTTTPPAPTSPSADSLFRQQPSATGSLAETGSDGALIVRLALWGVGILIAGVLVFMVIKRKETGR